MCVSNNFIEQQAYKISKQMQNTALYNVVRIENTDGINLISNIQEEQWNGKDFITKVILEDKIGNYYTVKPDNIGLRFAKGEISYKEYRKILQKENLKVYSYFLVSIGVIISLMLSVVNILN
jgi:hypothetical protein